jgi:hypothetical protein
MAIVVWYIGGSVFEEHAASIFRVEEACLPDYTTLHSRRQ